MRAILRSFVRFTTGSDPSSPAAVRNHLAMVAGIIALLSLGTALLFSEDTGLLMPGPLTSGHSAIRTCNTCHAQAGEGKLGWLNRFATDDAHADSKACLTCHAMPATAFNPHSAPQDILQESTRRAKTSAKATVAPAARIQAALFSSQGMQNGDLPCATCHQEHQGANFELAKLSNQQCRSCHVMQFDSFDGQHPQFQNYPFERRTRIIYDHAAHFNKHYPEVAKKEPKKRVPSICSDCHNSNADRRVMGLEPFDKTCSGCHLTQITGEERASGPKGIAFLSLPGIDAASLRKRGAAIGEWPEDSTAALTPFMKLMIGRSAKGRALVEAADKLNLGELANASEAEVQTATELAWEIKTLFRELIQDKGASILVHLNAAPAGKRNTPLLADLSAGLPFDVIASAQREWLPNLAAEIELKQSGNSESLNTLRDVPEDTVAGEPSEADANEVAPDANAEPAADEADSTASIVSDLGKVPDARSVRCADDDSKADAQVETGTGDPQVEDVAESQQAINGRIPLPSGTPRAIKSRLKGAERDPDGDESTIGSAVRDCEDDGKSANSDEPAQAAEAASIEKTDAGQAVDGSTVPEDNGPAGKKDDLLYPSKEELRASNLKALEPGSAAAAPEGSNLAVQEETPETEDEQASADPAAEDVQRPLTASAAGAGIISDVDPEDWAEHGGWYRQDYAISYRPAGHKDKFIHAWLTLAAPGAGQNGSSTATSIYDGLSGKDAQGSCTKCHSIDALRGGGRKVNFTPMTATNKQGRFSTFIHEPHFRIMDDRGCLSCHALQNGRPYLKGYDQGDPFKSTPEFSAVNKGLCQTCHNKKQARQDCLLCHTYHLKGATQPVTLTRLPIP